MHPYAKRHKLLQRVQVLLTFFTMILGPTTVESRHCNNGAVRTIQLFSQLAKGHVRIEGRKIVANSSNNYMDQTLQMITIDRHYFLLYDPNAKMFICWNRMYTNLLPKRNPKNLSFCTFEEKPSLIRPTGMTRYTTTVPPQSRPNRQSRPPTVHEVELRFNRGGAFAYPAMVRKCFEKWKWGKYPHHHRHRPQYTTATTAPLNRRNVDLVLLTLLDSVDRGDVEARKLYIQLAKYCAGPDFIVHLVTTQAHNCGTAYPKFCAQMRRIHKHHRLHPKLRQLCHL